MQDLKSPVAFALILLHLAQGTGYKPLSVFKNDISDRIRLQSYSNIYKCIEQDEIRDDW